MGIDGIKERPTETWDNFEKELREKSLDIEEEVLKGRHSEERSEQVK